MDARRLVTAVAALARTATGDFAPPEMLRVLCEAATDVLLVDGAGVMLRREDRNVFVHSSGVHAGAVAPLERLQEVLRDGPCGDAMALGSTVVSGDLTRDERWVEFQSMAADVQLKAVIAVPLLARGRGWGVLDLYRRTAADWTLEELQVARALADLAASYLVMAHDRDLAREAQQALAHQTMHDELTGLPNRALLFDRLDHALATAARRANGVAAVFLDLDLFKSVNDTFGHGT